MIYEVLYIFNHTTTVVFSLFEQIMRWFLVNGCLRGCSQFQFGKDMYIIYWKMLAWAFKICNYCSSTPDLDDCNIYVFADFHFFPGNILCLNLSNTITVYPSHFMNLLKVCSWHFNQCRTSINGLNVDGSFDNGL